MMNFVIDVGIKIVLNVKILHVDLVRHLTSVHLRGVLTLSKETYYVLERQEPIYQNPLTGDFDYEWSEVGGSRSEKPTDVGHKKTWRCVEVTTTRNVVPSVAQSPDTKESE